MPKTKKITTFILVVIFLISAKYYGAITSRFFTDNKVVSVNIGNQIIKAEIVSSNDDMQKGLGTRSDLCAECGMLFQFADTGKHSFWMKDMQFPLDIIWISEGKIVHLEKNIQPSFTGILTPPEGADTVLEINAKSVDRLGIGLGDNVSY